MGKLLIKNATVINEGNRLNEDIDLSNSSLKKLFRNKENKTRYSM